MVSSSESTMSFECYQLISVITTVPAGTGWPGTTPLEPPTWTWPRSLLLEGRSKVRPSRSFTWGRWFLYQESCECYRSATTKTWMDCGTQLPCLDKGNIWILQVFLNASSVVSRLVQCTLETISACLIIGAILQGLPTSHGQFQVWVPLQWFSQLRKHLCLQPWSHNHFHSRFLERFKTQCLCLI